MESINNLASTAAKTIWGDGNDAKEPISGQQGDVSKGEPYDAGNMDPSDQIIPDSSRDTTTATTSTTTPTTDTTTATSAKDTRSESQQTPGVATASDSTDTGIKDSDIKDTDIKDSDIKDAETKDAEVKDSGSDSKVSTADVTKDKDDVTGPGPKDLGALAKEHGGDAGNEETGQSAKSKGPDSSEKSKDEAKENKEKGTGEEYVKTSGFKADGGDFDATKPGAGMEADRLMEAKGVHREDKTAPAPSQDSSSPSSGSGGKDKDKPSLGERIKNKLHKH